MDQKGKATGGWLERLPPRIIQRIRDNRNRYDEMESRNSSLILPPEIIQEILLRLPITSVVQCSLLCKSFRKVAKNQNFALMHIKDGPDNSPFLIFHSIRGFLGSFPDYLGRLNIATIDGYVGMVKRIKTPFREIMVDYSIMGSCYGYLCLVSKEGPVSKQALLLYNPLTGHFKELPEPSKVSDTLPCGLGYDVGAGEYKVLMTAYCEEQSDQDQTELFGFGFSGENVQLEVQILTIGMSRWRTLQTPSCWLNEGGALSPFITHEQRGLWVNGSLHWLTSAPTMINGDWESTLVQQIIAFDLATEEFREITPPSGSSDLLAIRGNLSAFVNHERGSWEIWVMKDYDVPGSWTRDFVLGHYMPAVLRYSNSSSNSDLRNVRVVCCLNNGKVLLKFGYKAWCYYDPETELYEDLTLYGLPIDFETIAHVGSLRYLETL